jgi:hypothetical protein
MVVVCACCALTPPVPSELSRRTLTTRPPRAAGCAISDLVSSSEAAGLALDWEGGTKDARKALRVPLKQCLAGKLMTAIAGVTGAHACVHVCMCACAHVCAQHSGD